MHKLTPKKRLGQHFLHDARAIGRIAALVPATPDNRVLEVGPGEGALTEALLAKGAPLLAVELDPAAVRHLQQRFGQNPLFSVVQADVLHFAPPPGEWLLAGNLPYNISSPIFFWMLQHRSQFPLAVAMVQHEVAERICAGPGSKTYGILSVLMGQYYTAKYEFKVAPGAFRPPPAVQSGVASFLRRPEGPGGPPFRALRQVVKAAFGQRRKTLRNALKAIGLEPPAHLADHRAEQLPIEAFAELAHTWAAMASLTQWEGDPFINQPVE